MPAPQNATTAPVAYVATANPNAVLVLDTGTNHILDSVALGDLSAVADLAVSPDGKRAYITASQGGPHGSPQGALHVVDTATNEVLASITGSRSPGAVTLSPDGKRAYVGAEDSLQVIDTASNAILSSISFELPPKGVETDGKRLYVTNSLFSTWDDQFYPEIGKQGSHMIMLHCGDESGLRLDDNFYVDFSSVGDSKCPYRAHEMRYPGGDCTSDIWI